MPLQGLTEEQIAAATAPAEPTVIVAGPGSGKTRTIVARAVWYSRAIEPNRILLVTFTNKAAKEARSRLKEWGGGFVASTFHSLCARHLLPVTGGSIADEDEALSVMKEVINDGRLGLDAKPVAEWISMKRNLGYTLEAPPEEITTEYISAWEGYNKLKRQYRLHDYDDLLEDAIRFCVIDSIAPHFQLVLVDEVQDTNRPQLELVRRLAAPYRNVTIVGDHDQCVAADTPIMVRDGVEVEAGKLRPSHPIVAADRSGLQVVPIGDMVRLRGPAMRVEFADGRVLVCSPTHRMFMAIPRGTRGKRRESCLVYLMTDGGGRWRVGITSLVRKVTADTDGIGLAQRLQQERGRAAWVLEVCRTEDDARVLEASVSLRYGIPTTVFRASGRTSTEVVDGIFSAVSGGEAGATRLLADRGYSIDRPHVASCPNGELPRLSLVMNSSQGISGGNRSGHRVTITTSDPEVASLATSDPMVGRNVRAVKKVGGGNEWSGWRCDIFRSSYEGALQVATSLRQTLGDRVLYRQRAVFGSGQWYHVATASDLFPGAVVPSVAPDGSVSEVGVVGITPLDGEHELIDLSVPALGNFVANGIVVHNSIYGWRGAVPENIKDFADEFGAKVYPLTANHRSTGRIVALSRRVIEQYPSPIRAEGLHSVRADGHDPQIVECLNNDQEAEKVAQWAQDLMAQGVPPTEIAVLIRTNAQSQPLEAAFAFKKIPYTVVGALSFFDRAEVRDALSFLRVAANPFEVPAFRRSAQCMEGLGNESVKAVINEAATSKVSLLESLAAVRSRLRSEARSDAFLAYEDIMSDLSSFSPAEAVKRVTEAVLATKYASDDKEQYRLDNLDRLYQLAGRFGDLRDFLTMVTLATASDEEHKGVCVATCHAVKGLEFRAVWIAGVEDGLFPHARADNVAEECRLLYVACTRAKDLLVLSWCQVRKRWNDIIKCAPSQFLGALTGGHKVDD